MCNMMTMQSSLPPFVEDPACKSVSAKPLPLPVLRIAGRRSLPLSSERFLPHPSGVSFENEVFRLRTQAKISELVRTATTSEVCSTNALLAKKALKYRRVLERQPFARSAAVQC
ncbi:hypothetical protein PRIC1_008536 [Phytophthora ramorum]|uniref:uncharacterized protein n=1 Tax=Phytophthora ramorum TaxID=164328 RepID=UPI0030B4DB9E|nr:hypothetical protein KRP23_6697 [Phytophthora ramorum]KAH7500952.1 hypothetical protein KRP22_10196 [Phytophthora ramorum]